MKEYYNIPRDSHGRFLKGVKRGKAPQWVIDKISESQIGKELSEENINNIKLALQEKINLGWVNSAWYKKDTPLTEEHKNKLSIAKLGKKRPEKERERKSNNSKIMWAKVGFKDKQIKLILNGLMKRPTSYEQKISNLCFKHNLPFIYKGNGDFLINFKNPDFVNENDKVVIEVFYSWFKIRDYGSVENYKEFCKEKYHLAGWRVIFIDELDLNCENWEEICLNKINNKEILI